jgi:mannose-1-phosphate guanylyltransferase/mannose-6-phosphate isomerase
LFTDLIILAGGIGERLWPLSTAERPKQFILIPGGLSFFQMALERAMLFRGASSIIVVTRRGLEALALEQCLAFRETLPAPEAARFTEILAVLTEPCPRHTAAAVHLALTWTALRQPGGGQSPRTALVLTSDHIISTKEQFAASCSRTAPSVASGYFACFGIPPEFPATGFGYIEAGARVPGEEGVYEVKSFKEKPDEETAREFLAQGNYWWNSGMVAFNEDFYRREVEKFAPGIAACFSALAEPAAETVSGLTVVRKWKNLEAVYSEVSSVSIDSAVAEHTEKARCVAAGFSWDDIGSWDAFAARVPWAQENAVLLESRNCSVYSDIPVALCGVSDLIVAVHKGKALVMRKGKSSLVREAVREVEA